MEDVKVRSLRTGENDTNSPDIQISGSDAAANLSLAVGATAMVVHEHAADSSPLPPDTSRHYQDSGSINGVATKDKQRPPEFETPLMRHNATKENNETADIYFGGVNKTPLLTADEERELAKKIEAGREAQALLDAGCSSQSDTQLKRTVREATEARDYFIGANLGLAVNFAMRYPVPSGMELQDLIQEGCIALEHAVRKFDWRKGFRFTTYAAFWLRKYLSEYIDRSGPIRLPLERTAELRNALNEVFGNADELEGEVARLYRLSTPTSFDRVIGEGEDNTLHQRLSDSNFTGPEEFAIESSMAADVARLLETVDPDIRTIVEHRFGIVDGTPRTFKEIAEILGICPKKASKVVRRIIDELNNEDKAYRLKSYV